jgi:hypothetical protein
MWKLQSETHDAPNTPNATSSDMKGPPTQSTHMQYLPMQQGPLGPGNGFPQSIQGGQQPLGPGLSEKYRFSG